MEPISFGLGASRCCLECIELSVLHPAVLVLKSLVVDSVGVMLAGSAQSALSQGVEG